MADSSGRDDRDRERDDADGSEGHAPARSDARGDKERRGRRDADDEDDGDGKHGDDDADAGDDDGDGDDDADDGDDDEPSGPPLYKKPLFWIIAALVAAVLIVGGTLWWLHARQYESTDDAFVDTHIVRLAPQVAGVLLRVAPDIDNRHVRAGQLLAVIEPSGPEAQLAEARAGVLQAEAQVRQQQANVIAAFAQRRQAAAQAIGPLADAGKAARDYARYLDLYRRDAAAVAPTQVDAARSTAARTAADARAARQQIATADAQVTVARKQVSAAQAQVAAAQARVKQAGVTIGNLNLVAPVAGQVVNRQVNVGSYVAPGTQLMAIVPDTIWITANFKETQLRYMRKGQAVRIRVDAFPDVDFEGHVDSIQRGSGQAFALLPAQNATGNYVKVVQRVPVRILFDRPDPRRWSVGPGMSVVPTVKVR